MRTVKSPYLCSRLTDFDEIWHNDAYWPPTAETPLKFRIFGNSRWRQPPSGKSKKSRYLRNGLTDLYEIWYADEKRVSQQPRHLKKFEFHKSKMAYGRHFKNRYIILSQQPFDWFLLNFGTVMHVGPQSMA